MANSASVNFTDSDNTASVTPALNGIAFLRGESLRGPYDDPSEIITTWAQFKRIFGGLTNQESTLLMKRGFDKGMQARFSKIGHYTTIATRSTLTAEKAEPDEIIAGTDEDETEVFELVLKNPGADYNNVKVQITAGSNGTTGYFNVYITHALEPELNETYQNLIVGTPTTVANSNFLQRIVESSELMDVVYKDLSAVEAPIIAPQAVIINYTGGTDGGVIVDTDIIGDSASSTGFHSFDDYDDSLELVILAADVSDAVHIAGSAYADMREDLQYWGFLSNGLVTRAQLTAKRDSLNIDSRFTMFFAGGLYVKDETSSLKRDIEGATDIVALALASDRDFGPWYSFAGNQRGTITNALGVVNNFGTTAKKADLNLLAQRQINTIINRDKKTKLWNLLSAQQESNQYSFSNVVRGVIYIKKSLRPTMENYIEDPNDIPTWNTLYLNCKPFMDDLITKRALFSYRWLGDQDASSLDNLQINRKVDVLQGKYKIRLILSFIPGMREITVELALDQGTGTVDITEVNN